MEWSTGCNDFCRRHLKEWKEVMVAGNHKGVLEVMKGSYIEGPCGIDNKNKRYYFVKDKHGVVLWDGYTCCKYSARAKAFSRLSNEE